MSDACFIAYLKTPDLRKPLKDNTSACVVYQNGHPGNTGAILYMLMARRLFAENLLDACKFLIDQGRENNGYERLSFAWVADCQAGERLYAHAYARYGVDAIKKTIFKRGKPLPYNNTYVKIPLRPHDTYEDLTNNIEFVDREAPLYSGRELMPIQYKDPFNITLFDSSKMINTEHLWLYLIDPFNEEFRVFHAEPVYKVGAIQTDFSDHVRLAISYRHLATASLKTGKLRKLLDKRETWIEEVAGYEYQPDSTGYCRLLIDKEIFTSDLYTDAYYSAAADPINTRYFRQISTRNNQWHIRSNATAERGSAEQMATLFNVDLPTLITSDDFPRERSSAAAEREAAHNFRRTYQDWLEAIHNLGYHEGRYIWSQNDPPEEGI